ncbi:hypothetical protein ASD11_16660 [Aeromicrobium sp. Root495]|uniref:PsbP-related protein n=1 Tax=Aeromicrobium sp. Root495 TaxID=1736550 RepID=UPI0006FAF34B|nr:hypothetical protein [Aeromicrobium sp. Root495]KQY56095.1 hypothetical protein ASD11_16660 [Aeromicrobium sp. Root495]RYJ07256.1 MAG: hypothetical protein EON52_02190 [Actinomycetales bacterium]
MTRTRIAAVALTASLALTACGGGDDKKSSDDTSGDSKATAAAATGAEQSADDFTFNAPDGWEAKDASAMPSVNFEVLAADPNDKDGFTDNVNVVSDPAIANFQDLDDRADAAKKGLAMLSTENMKVEDPVSLDGDDATVISYTAKVGSNKIDQRQYYVAHGDNGYVVTFSYSEDRPDAEQQEIAESVAASWSWKS